MACPWRPRPACPAPRTQVARDIEPVVSWLRAQGLSREQVAELVQHTPAVLSAGVEAQLEPLAGAIRAAGGRPRDVLAAYPGLAAVPVAQLLGTRHVLRQLGVDDEEWALLLTHLPDLAAALAHALARLFAGACQRGGESSCAGARWAAGACFARSLLKPNPAPRAI